MISDEHADEIMRNIRLATNGRSGLIGTVPISP